MASYTPARLHYLPLLVLLLLAALCSPSVRPSPEYRRRRRRSVEHKPTALPPAAVPWRARQEFHFHVAPRTTGQMRERRSRARGVGRGTGAWAFSAMLPREFLPPSGSSECHNDMPANAADAQFFACGGAGTP